MKGLRFLERCGCGHRRWSHYMRIDMCLKRDYAANAFCSCRRFHKRAAS